MFIVDGKRFPTVTASGIYGFFQAYRYLGNFHVCTVVMDGRVYPSSEHAYMAMKTLDPKIRLEIAGMSKPADARRFGRSSRVQLRRGWDDMRVSVMEKVIEAKFMNNRDLARKLIATGDKHLEEANDWHDTFWGTVDGHGQNQLGKALMRVRRKLALVCDPVTYAEEE